MTFSSDNLSEENAERRAETLAAFSARLKQLHRLSTSSYDDINALLNDYLQTGCDMFGMKAGVINRVEGDRCVFRVGVGTMPGLEAGRVYHRSKMYCEAVIDQRQTVAYPNAYQVEKLRDHPAYQQLNVQSYLGTPILIGNDELYGVLLFASDEPHRRFSQQDREIVELMAEGIERFLAQEQAEAERRHAMEALRDSEQRFRAIFDSTFQFTGLMKPDGTLIEANQTALDFGGLTHSDVIGKPLWECYWWTLSAKTQERLKEAVVRAAKGIFIRYNEEMLNAEGEAVTIDFSIKPVLNSEGEVTLLIPEGRDISERMKAEAELRASRQLLSGVLGSTLDAIMAFETVRDEAGEVVDFEWLLANPRSEELTGRAADELIGQRLCEEHALDHINFFDRYRRVVETDRPFWHEFYRDVNGKVQWLQATGVRLGDGLTVTFRDITESKQAAQALKASEDLLSSVLGSSLDGIMAFEAVRDEAGEVVDFEWLLANPRSEELTGRAADELIGQRLLEEMPGNREAGLFDAYVRVVETGEPFSEELYYEHEEMHAWLHVTAVKLGDGFAVTFRDVTERIEAERALERTNAALTQRNRELQDFAYVASHDLQEPLRKIRAFGDLLQDDYGSAFDETGAYYLERMRDAATRMSRLISDLLAFSRITTKARPFEPVDLNKTADNVLSDLTVRMSEVEGTVEVDELPTIEADPTQMHQLMQNLIGNALKFHRPDVRPVVEVRAAVEEAGEPLDGTAYCRIAVQDNGIGFDEKYLDRIFTPFQRLHGRGKYAGTGMGLAICRRIVERHSGTIEAHSRPNEGSTFIIRLPFRQLQDEKATDNEPKEENQEALHD